MGYILGVSVFTIEVRSVVMGKRKYAGSISAEYLSGCFEKKVFLDISLYLLELNQKVQH